MGSNTEWQVNVGALADLYKGLETPIELHSRKRSVDLSEYQCNQNESVATDHFVVVNQYPDTESLRPWESGEARSEKIIGDVESTCRQVRDARSVSFEWHGWVIPGNPENQPEKVSTMRRPGIEPDGKSSLPLGSA